MCDAQASKEYVKMKVHFVYGIMLRTTGFKYRLILNSMLMLLSVQCKFIGHGLGVDISG